MTEATTRSALIVVVDSNAESREVLKSTLAERGYQVEALDSAAMISAAFVEHGPELVILDSEYPDDECLASCEKIRRLPGGNTTPIVLLSDRGDAVSVDRAYRAGATDFFVKPVNWPTFSRRIENLIRVSEDNHNLRKTETELNLLLDALPDTLIVLNSEDIVADFIPGKLVNPLPRPAAERASVYEFLPALVAKSWCRARAEAAEKGEHVQIEFSLGEQDDLCYYEARFVPFTERRTLAMVADISVRKRAEQSIRKLAFYDNLTGLPNRQAFRLQLSGMIDEATESGSRVAVLYIDLDNFKRINDTLGHTIGDGILNSIAERLAGSIRSHEHNSPNADFPVGIARLGGDEFACAISGFSDDDVLSGIAERIGEQLRKPVRFNGHEFIITPSVGISVYPDDGDNVEDLLKNADVAMYQAKDAGRDGVRFYSGTLAIRSLHGLALEHDLRKALENDVLELHYQPKVDLGTGMLVGAEALVRWRNEDGDYVPPSSFIPMAEKTGQIVPLGEQYVKLFKRAR